MIKSHSSYEDWAWSLQQAPPQPPNMFESYRGTDVVGWYGSIERSLVNMLENFRKDRNIDEADKVQQFLRTWREQPISGSINREEIVPLEAAAAQLSVDRWKGSNYFSNLRDQLRKLLADQEQLPMAGPMEAPGRGGGRRSSPTSKPPPAQFSADKVEPTPGQEDENAATAPKP